MKRLHIQRAPIGVSLQDAGRNGYLRYGVSTAGPMDWAHHAMANSMLGKSFGDTAIEVGPAGMDLILDAGDLQLSFAGPGFVINHAGRD
jgi:allophanate hydrolase subunit 2